uniref:Uncharacterized protein n=1 Tax=Arundo donax TaxID=35708 RepID=A0A0A9B6H5_ARUDO
MIHWHFYRNAAKSYGFCNNSGIWASFRITLSKFLKLLWSNILEKTNIHPPHHYQHMNCPSSLNSGCM